jgi:hypothetical protein
MCACALPLLREAQAAGLSQMVAHLSRMRASAS